MRGFLSTESVTVRWSRLVAASRPRMLLANAAVGVMAGVVLAHVRLHLGVPGYRALLWLTPVLLARLVSGCPIGATAGATAAACTSLALGGNLAGGLLFLPLVAVAGAVGDAAVLLAGRLGLGPWTQIPVIGVAGMAANGLCAIKRLLVPVGRYHVFFGVGEPWSRLVSYGAFGLAAGLIGATLAAIILSRRKKPGSTGGFDGAASD